MIREYNFSVEVITSGQERRYGDSKYHYRVTSKLDESDVKNFCMFVLRKSYVKSEMPDWASGQLTKFQKITDNNKNIDIFGDRLPEIYEYKVTEAYTG